MAIRILFALAALCCLGAAPVSFTDLATPFEQVALTTAGQPEATRVAAVRRTLSAFRPGRTAMIARSAFFRAPCPMR